MKIYKVEFTENIVGDSKEGNLKFPYLVSGTDIQSVLISALNQTGEDILPSLYYVLASVKEEEPILLNTSNNIYKISCHEENIQPLNTTYK